MAARDGGHITALIAPPTLTIENDGYYFRE
jgi:hypothetical protein